MTARRAKSRAEGARLADQQRELEQLRAGVAAWRANAAALPVRDDLNTTSVSGAGVEPVYTSDDVRDERSVCVIVLKILLHD